MNRKINVKTHIYWMILKMTVNNRISKAGIANYKKI